MLTPTIPAMGDRVREAAPEMREAQNPSTSGQTADGETGAIEEDAEPPRRPRSEARPPRVGEDPVGPAGERPASAFSPVAYPRDRADQPARTEPARQGGVLRWIILLFVGVLVGAGALYGSKSVSKIFDPGDVKPGEDKLVDEKIRGEHGTEIHDWFIQDHSRTVGTLSESQALAMADQLSDLGAKRVLAFGHATNELAIEMPDDKAMRKALVSWQADFNRQHNQKIWEDEGQKYLLIRLGSAPS